MGIPCRDTDTIGQISKLPLGLWCQKNERETAYDSAGEARIALEDRYVSGIARGGGDVGVAESLGMFSRTSHEGPIRRRHLYIL